MDVLIVGAEAAPDLPARAFTTHVVATPIAAVGWLSAHRADLVLARREVSDADAERLLAHVREHWPTVVRVLERDCDHPVQALEEAHRVIIRTGEPPDLERALVEAAELRGDLDQRLVTSLVQRFDGLPSAPDTWAELTRRLSHPQTASVSAVAALVERDVAMTASVLRLANSALLSRGRRLASVHEAIVRLGFQTLQHAVLGAEVERLFARATAGGASVSELSELGLARGVLASSLVTDREERGAAFVAGMMLEVGQLVCACYIPDETWEIRALARERGWTLHEAEAVRWGVTHANVGARLLEAWNLPTAAVTAALLHHEMPERHDHIDAATAARAARYALGSSDPLDPVDDLLGWDDLLGAVLARRRAQPVA